MTEPTPIILSSPDAGNRGAGEMLRLAREAQNMSLEGLASIIKVAPAKLEALELDQFDRLSDANFTRALAMTVCRDLKIDPSEVLAALPAARPAALAEGKPPLNQPFKDVRGGTPLFDRQWDWTALLSLKWLAPISLLAGAVVIYVLPDSVELPAWVQQALHGRTPAVEAAAVESAASSASELPVPALSPDVLVAEASQASSGVMVAPAAASAAASGSLVLDAVDSGASSPALVSAQDARLVPAVASAPVVSAPGASTPVAGPLVVTVTEASWIEVRDAKGIKLLSQQVRPGETLSLNGTPPLKALVGNAAGVNMSYKGQRVDLAAQARNNVARVELK